MTDIDIARAWRDPKYRRSLGAAAARLPESPAGVIELTDEELKIAGGMAQAPIVTTAPTCTAFTFLGWKACGCQVLTTHIYCTVMSYKRFATCGCP